MKVTALLRRLNLNLASRTRANFQFQEIQAIEEQDNGTTRKLIHPECGTPCRTTSLMGMRMWSERFKNICFVYA